LNVGANDGYGLRDDKQLPVHQPGAGLRRHLQEGPRMKKKFAAFVAVATIAGSLAATPASAQRGVAAGVSAPRYYRRALDGKRDEGARRW